MLPDFVKQTLRALRHRNYRLFFSGQSLSLIGTWMQQVALGWLVYRLTDSAFLLGLVGFSSQIPTFILASFAGVLADRYNKHKIINCHTNTRNASGIYSGFSHIDQHNSDLANSFTEFIFRIDKCIRYANKTKFCN